MRIKSERIIEAISLIGIVISIYLTLEHFTPIPLYCPEASMINCQAVTTSSYSTLFGLPIAFFGIFYFLLIFIFKLVKMELSVFLLSILGIFTAFFLFYVESNILHKFCIWCSVLHLILLTIFLIQFYVIYNKE